MLSFQLSRIFSVKPDKSSEDKKIESLFLLERRKLISCGTDSKSIKLYHNKILVDNVMCGMVGLNFCT